MSHAFHQVSSNTKPLRHQTLGWPWSFHTTALESGSPWLLTWIRAQRTQFLKVGETCVGSPGKCILGTSPWRSRVEDTETGHWFHPHGTRCTKSNRSAESSTQSQSLQKQGTFTEVIYDPRDWPCERKGQPKTSIIHGFIVAAEVSSPPRLETLPLMLKKKESSR